MEINCPECKELVGHIADEKVPVNIKGNVTCPLCQTKIAVFRKSENSSDVAQNSGSSPDKDNHGSESEKTDGATYEYSPDFSGIAGEFFRIWIVNVFLTIVTFGIYAAWAKVRTRRYFYANTNLASHPFDYLANPVTILKGNLVIAAGLIIYNSSQVVSPMFGLAIAIIFAIIVPFLIFKSLRFYAHNSAFRNIKFLFNGTLKESYLTYLLLPICIPLTLGLIIPYWAYRRKKYFFQNFSYGSAANDFSGEASYFYFTYMKAFALAIGATVIMGVISAIAIPSFSAIISGDASQLPVDFKPGMVFFIALFFGYLFMLTLFSAIQQYIYVKLTNYCWNHSVMGKLRFESTMQVRQMLWIRISNMVAIIFSVGLLAPWAKIRRTRYIIANLTVVTTSHLDDITSTVGESESAYGDAATDFFDFEIGL